MPEWISVKDRLPTVLDCETGLVGIVNGHNGKQRFVDALILLDYDFDEDEFFSPDYLITNCRVDYWMSIPKPPEDLK